MKYIIPNITNYIVFNIFAIFTISCISICKLSSQVKTQYLSTKVYIDNPQIVEDAVTYSRSVELMDSINQVLKIHGIVLNCCFETLTDDTFYNDPNLFFGRWSECKDPDKLAIYLRPEGFQSIAGRGSGNGQMWTEADINTLGHELGHVFGLQHTNNYGECLSEKGHGDGIDDTPFHPELFDENDQPLPGYFDECSVNWLNVVDFCGTPIIDVSNPNYIAIVKEYKTNLENNFMAQIYHPNVTTCHAKSYTIKQGERMRAWISSRLRKFLTDEKSDCDNSVWQVINEDISFDTSFKGIVVIEKSIKIKGRVEFLDGIVMLKQNANMTFTSGSDVRLNNVIFENFNSCQYESNNKIVVEKDCQFNINTVQFRDLTDGVEIYSSNGSIEKVLFGYVGLSSNVTGLKILDLDNLGYQDQPLVLTDIECAHTDVIVENSSVEMNGPEFYYSDVICNGSNVVLSPSKSNRRPTFVSKSRLVYHSGALLQIDNAYFDSNITKPSVEVYNCDKAIISRSLFNGSNNAVNGLLALDGIEEHLIFDNVFNGANDRSIDLASNKMGIVRNNIFKNNKVGIAVVTDGDAYHFECNFHENNDIAWKIDDGVKINTQGLNGVPSNNKFIDSKVHVSNDMSFDYYYDIHNTESLDFLKSKNVAMKLTDSNDNHMLSETFCKSENDISGQWESWENYNHVFLYEWESLLNNERSNISRDIAWPRYIYDFENLEESKDVILDNYQTKNYHEDLSQVDLDSRSKLNKAKHLSGVKIFPNPVVENVTITTHTDAATNIFDSSGKLVLSTRLRQGLNDVDVQSLPSGIYNIQLEMGDNQILNRGIVKN